MIDVSVPNELYEEKRNEFKENKVVMIKGTVSADDYRRENLEDVGIKVRATDIMSIDSSRALVTSYIRLILPMSSIKTLANGSFKQFEELNSPNGVDVMLLSLIHI